jgi:hypothetical protein
MAPHDKTLAGGAYLQLDVNRRNVSTAIVKARRHKAKEDRSADDRDQNNGSQRQECGDHGPPFALRVSLAEGQYLLNWPFLRLTDRF